MSASEPYVSSLFAEVSATSVPRRKGMARQICGSAVIASEVLADWLVASACTLAAMWVQFRFQPGSSASALVAAASAVGMAAAFLLRTGSEVEQFSGLARIRETEKIMRTTLQCAIVLVPATLLLGLRPSGAEFLVMSLLTTPALMAERRIVRSTIRVFHARGLGAERVAIIGSPEAASHVASALMQSPRWGLYPAAVVYDENAPADDCVFRFRERSTDGTATYCGPMTETLLESLQCSTVIRAVPSCLLADWDEIAGQPELSDRATFAEEGRAYIEMPGYLEEPTTPFAGIDRTLPLWHLAFLKRAADVAIASILLVVLTPVLLLIAILIRLDSPGPVFFVQDRIGRAGTMFAMFKFRSMHVNASAYELSPRLSSDSRITNIGRLLRRAGLDELPQLVNVLLGQMSLVGPRPEMPFLVERYYSDHRRRLEVKPGITGLWQLSMDRGLPIHENTQYDLYYIRNRTFCMDLAILLHTLFFAMRGGV